MKIIVKIFTILLFTLWANSCSENSASSSNNENNNATEYSLIELDNQEGLKRMTSYGAEVLLDNKMQVKLDYDFYIGTHEITCGEFKSYLEQQGYSTPTFPGCENDSLPVTNVSFYDAVLYANYRSKQENLDTVYSYSNVLFSSIGQCLSMDGFSFNPKVDGFRLPTEAEWIFAAQISWDPTQSWHVENSNYQIHSICTQEIPKSGLCDMAGNALEWINDRKDELIDSTVTDFVGALTNNTAQSQVVKGGCYRTRSSEINWISRSDTYETLPTYTSDYLGFRLALGKIPNPVWLSGLHQTLSSNINLRVTSLTMRNHLGTVKSKLAFRDEISGNLFYIDFGGWNPEIIEIPDTLNVYHPEISPNGKWVAFCTSFEGSPEKSSLYVRKLDRSGSNLTKLDVESAAIPRWKVLDDGDTVITYVTDGENNKDEATFKSKGTWQVSFNNGSFGKPVKLLDGAFNGGIYGNLAIAGARLLRANIDKKDTVWYNGEQACNASLSRSGNKETLFLDFAGQTGRKFTGETYGTHQRLFLADSLGNILKAIPSPAEKSFDHTEWTVGTNIHENGSDKKTAIASITDVNGHHEAIALVDLYDSSIAEIVNGEELWHPCLWVLPKNYYESVGLDPDSAGMYHNQNESSIENLMKVKMRLFWDYKDSIEMVAVGSSRTERGFNPLRITKQFAFNAGTAGSEMQSGIYFLRHYALNHAQALKTVVVELSLDMFRWQNTMYQLLYKTAPGYIYDRDHNFWKDGISKDFLDLVDENMEYTHQDSVKYVDTRGFYRIEANGWGGDSALIIRDSIFSNSEITNEKNLIDSLGALLKESAERNIRVIGVIYPQSPAYANTGAFGKYGLQRSRAKDILKEIDSLSLMYPNFTLMDENKMGSHDYTDDMAEDYDHLSEQGAAQLSSRLDSLVNSLE